MTKITNEQKYKTAEERTNAYDEWCTPRGCEICELFDADKRVMCAFKWLALEAKDEKPEDCPFCGGKCVEATPCEDHPHIVKCIECGYTTPENAYETFADAVAAHNRVARAVRAARESEVK